jgi:hypothetical protein
MFGTSWRVARIFLTDVDRRTLPVGATVPALVRLRHVHGPVLDAECHDAIGQQQLPRWLLLLDREELVEHEAVQVLLAAGKAQGLHLRHLTSIRDPWYRVETVLPPDIFVSPMSKGHLRAVWNKLPAVHSNSMYGIYVNEKELVSPLARYLNSPQGQKALRAHGRHYGKGLIKLEPKNFLAVQVPSPKTLVAEFGEDRGSVPPSLALFDPSSYEN